MPNAVMLAGRLMRPIVSMTVTKMPNRRAHSRRRS
jgi:hypothetical protein